MGRREGREGEEGITLAPCYFTVGKTTPDQAKRHINAFVKLHATLLWVGILVSGSVTKLKDPKKCMKTAKYGVMTARHTCSLSMFLNLANIHPKCALQI